MALKREEIWLSLYVSLCKHWGCLQALPVRNTEEEAEKAVSIRREILESLSALRKISKLKLSVISREVSLYKCWLCLSCSLWLHEVAVATCSEERECLYLSENVCSLGLNEALMKLSSLLNHETNASLQPGLKWEGVSCLCWCSLWKWREREICDPKSRRCMNESYVKYIWQKTGVWLSILVEGSASLEAVSVPAAEALEVSLCFVLCMEATSFWAAMILVTWGRLGGRRGRYKCTPPIDIPLMISSAWPPQKRLYLCLLSALGTSDRASEMLCF